MKYNSLVPILSYHIEQNAIGMLYRHTFLLLKVTLWQLLIAKDFHIAQAEQNEKL